MLECPSRLKQRGATCLIQSRCNWSVVCCCIGENSDLCTIYSHSHPQTAPSIHPIITRNTFLHKVMQVSSRFITLHDGRRPFSFFQANAALVNLEPDEQNFTSARAGYYPQLGIILYAGYTVPLSSTPYIIWPAQPIYTMAI